MGSEGELSSGYKLVPWSSWDQWNFVRESLFSSSPDSVSRALKRICAWRCRGCLPVPIDVTAAIVEIQQKDPFFSQVTTSDALNSEEMLAMLYCMSIMRLVNCFVEPAHKKTGRSISELADAIGIPRVLVDIRHESSHRNLPSIRLVRMASMKALDWLKSNYWEPQRSAIPDVRKEVRLRLREMSIYLRIKRVQRCGSSQGKGKRFMKSGVLMRCNRLSSQIVGKLQASKSDASDKRISKITKIISRLYSSYSSDVVAVILEFFHLQVSDFSDGTDMECSDDSNADDPGIHVDAMCDLKTIITKISSKKPGLILSILKMVLEMIEVKESTQSPQGGCQFLSSKHQRQVADISRLCSLVHWLLLHLKSLIDSGRIGVIGESPVFSAGRLDLPTVSLKNLFRKILSLTVIGDKHLSRSVFLLARMIDNTSLTARLKQIPLLPMLEQVSVAESAPNNTESLLLKEEASLKQVAEKLEFFKLRLRDRSSRNLSNGRTDAAANKTWTVAKSWNPCPIGMLPCSFSSTGVLPILDKVNTDTIETDTVETKTGLISNGQVTEKREADHNIDEHETGCKRLRTVSEEQESDLPEISFHNIDEHETACKRLQSVSEEQESDFPEISSSPMEGRLLIGGIWKKVSEEELLDIESKIRIFAELLPVQT